jgi:uncharacterized protein YcaQ
LNEDPTIHRIHVAGLAGGGERYVHDQHIGLLESMDTDAWELPMSLLSPFDNLICGKDRTKRIFGFEYVHENYLPKNNPKFGSCVLPILRGDRFIGRIDPEMDREHERLLINSVHAEPATPGDKEVSSRIRRGSSILQNFSRRRKSSTRRGSRKPGGAHFAESH